MTTLNHLLPEENDGNIEYKWKLCDISHHKIHQLTTQMLFRLTEGNGCAEYYLGVTDKGGTAGILKSELNMTLLNLIECSRLLGARVVYYKIFIQPPDKQGIDRYCVHVKVHATTMPCDKICV